MMSKKDIYARQAAASTAKLEAQLPYIKEKEELEVQQERLKTQQKIREAETLRKQAEEQQLFNTSRKGRETKKLQEEAKLNLAEAQAAQAKAVAKQANKVANPGIIAEAKNAIASNLPASNVEPLLVPQSASQIGYAPSQAPVNQEPGFSNLGSIQVRQTINPQTGQPEYYITDTGAVQAARIGGGIANTGISSANNVLVAVGGTSQQGFADQAANNSDAILTAVGGTTPYPKAANPIEVARARGSEYVPENPAQVERAIDMELAREEKSAPVVQRPVPAPRVAPRPVIRPPVFKPVQNIQKRKPNIVRPITIKPVAEAGVEKPKPEHKVRHGHVGRPRAVGRVSKKALRERERRARQREERLRMRG
jgi:hypothetical protein